MNLDKALLDSGMWLIQAYLITVVLSAATIWGLAKFTVWGRQFWSLTAAFFSPRRDWRPLATLLLILLLTLCAVRLDVLLSDWSNTMYTSLQKLDSSGFWRAMALFAILATAHVLRVLIEFYIQQAFTIRWRVWLNEELLSRWLARQTYYRTQYLDTPIDNPDQRIQQDVATFVEMSLALSMGVINALVSTFAFTAILWTLSGPLSAMGVEVPRGMVFLVFAYVIIATVFAVKIGRPLIMLNFLNERFNADYRYALVRLREYSESIAFYAGEKVEGALLRSRFAHIIGNAWAIVYRSIKFQGFNLSVSQAAVVFPFIIQAQRFFSKQISLGDLMQTAQAFGRLQDNLSFFRTAYDSFATYRATLDRLNGFTKAIVESRELPEPTIHAQGPRLAVEQLTINTPAGALLIDRLDLETLPGAPLLIQGPSGSGKTTLLRAIAGLWPYCDGTIIRPADQVLFLSQKPYLPLGSLRDALYYPNQLPSLETGARADIHQQQNAAMASTHGAPSDLDALAMARSSELGAEPETSSLAMHEHASSTSQAADEAASSGTPAGIGGHAGAEEVLRLVQLGHLADRLDQVADWGRILSLGEQQRLAFGRLLLAVPVAAFLDEATSAMDEGLEDAMYRLVREQLPHTRLVSVGHRSTLSKHHAWQLVLKGKGSGAWELASIS